MSEPRLRHFLSDTFLVLGLALFGLSMFQPIITLVDVTPPLGELRIVLFDRVDFYSYKVNYYFAEREFYSDSFNGYWFSNAYLDHSYVTFNSFSLIATFATQIAGFIVILATFPRKRKMRAVSLVSIVTAALMVTLFFFSFSSYSIFIARVHGQLIVGRTFKWNLTGGYWFTILSAICVSLSIIMSRERSTVPNLWMATRQ
jgi:hypothetical protein